MKALTKFLEKYALEMGPEHINAYQKYGEAALKEKRLENLVADIANTSKLSKHDEGYLFDIWLPELKKAGGAEIKGYMDIPGYTETKRGRGTNNVIIKKIYDLVNKTAPKKPMEPWEF